MEDANGRTIELVDQVKLWDDVHGIVVCDFDKRRFSDAFPEAGWGYLGKGVLIETEAWGLFHYEDSGELEVIPPE